MGFTNIHHPSCISLLLTAPHCSSVLLTAPRFSVLVGQKGPFYTTVIFFNFIYFLIFFHLFLQLNPIMCFHSFHDIFLSNIILIDVTNANFFTDLSCLYSQPVSLAPALRKPDVSMMSRWPVYKNVSIRFSLSSVCF